MFSHVKAWHLASHNWSKLLRVSQTKNLDITSPRPSNIPLRPIQVSKTTLGMEATPQSSPLFKLSAELRNEIYHLVLLEEGEVTVSNAGIPEAPLLSVGKATREEAIQIYYSRNVFHVRVEGWQSGTLVGWSLKLCGLDAAYGLKLKWHWCVKEDDVNMANLHVWLQQCHANPDFFRLAPRPMPPSGPRAADQKTLIRNMFGHVRQGTGILTWTEAEKSLEIHWYLSSLINAGWRK
jgi:hypothetical protein